MVCGKIVAPAGRVPLPAKAVQVAAGEDTSFALLDDGTIWFWGEQSGAQGLLGVRGNQRVPVKVPMEKLLPR
jgi:alpha-tubulin suppressor-like RCC1 family protein